MEVKQSQKNEKSPRNETLNGNDLNFRENGQKTSIPLNSEIIFEEKSLKTDKSPEISPKYSKKDSKNNFIELTLREKYFEEMIAAKFHESTRSIHSTLKSAKIRDKIWNLLKFIVLRLLIPTIFFSIISHWHILTQILVKGYCFCMLCNCENFWIFLYTIISELMSFDAILVIGVHYLVSFITSNFQKKKKIKIFYKIFWIFVLILLNALGYSKRNEFFLVDLRKIKVVVSFGVSYVFSLTFCIINKDINRDFAKRFFLAVLLQMGITFNMLLFKGEIQFIVLEYIQKTFDSTQYLGIFKLFLLFYNIGYAYLSTSCLFLFYKHFMRNEKMVSLNLVTILMKFVFLDVYSIKTLNILTSEISEKESWISFIFYFYSMVCIYSGHNFINTIIFKIKNLCFKANRPTLESKYFEDLKNGCILEMNIIILSRIIIYKCFHYFLYMSKSDVYEDCSLFKKVGTFDILTVNLNLIIPLHLTLIAFSIIFILVKKKILFNIQLEKSRSISKFFLFNAYMNFVDCSLIYYKLLQD